MLAFVRSVQRVKSVIAFKKNIRCLSGISEFRFGEVMRRANDFVAKGQPNKAVGLFDEILKEDPKHIESNFQKGLLLIETDSKKSIHHLQVAVQLDPNDPEKFGGLIMALLNSDRALEASKVVEQSVAKFPNSSILLTMRSQLFALGGRLDMALKSIDQAIKCDHNDARPVRFKASLLQATGRTREADALNQQADLIDNYSPNSNEQIDQQQQQQKEEGQEEEEEEEEGEEKQSMSAEDMKFYELIEKAEQATKDQKYQESAKLFVQATKIRPNCALTALHAGNQLGVIGLNEEAEMELIRAEKMMEKDPNMFGLASTGYMQLGKLDKSFELVERGLVIEPQNMKLRSLRDYLKKIMESANNPSELREIENEEEEEEGLVETFVPDQQEASSESTSADKNQQNDDDDEEPFEDASDAKWTRLKKK